jgi:hypothetical protein
MNNKIDFQIDQVTARYEWDRVLSTTRTQHKGFLGIFLEDSVSHTSVRSYRVVDAITNVLIESDTSELPPVSVRPTYVVRISGDKIPESLIETCEALKGLNYMFNPKIAEVDVDGHTLYGLMVTQWDEKTNTGTAGIDFIQRR